MTGPSVVIVGAGAVGLATADALLARGVRPIVIERAGVASGSSGLSVGVIESQYLERGQIEPRVLARRFFDRLAAEDGLDFARCGYLRPAFSKAALERCARSVEIQRELGVRDARVLVPAEIAELAPDVRLDDALGALWSPSDGYIDPFQYCSILAERVRRGGVEIRIGTELVGAERRPGGLQLETSAGPLRCDVVVNAAGPWATRVGDLLEAPVAVVPQRRSAAIAHLDAPLAYPMPFVMFYAPGDGRLGAYVRAERADQLVVGLHSEEILDPAADPDDFPRGVDQDFMETLAEALADRLPGLAAGIRLAHGWSGLYPVGVHGPTVGRHPDRDDVFCAIGFGGSGLQASPAAGAALAECILGRVVDPAPTA